MFVGHNFWTNEWEDPSSLGEDGLRISHHAITKKQSVIKGHENQVYRVPSALKVAGGYIERSNSHPCPTARGQCGKRLVATRPLTMLSYLVSTFKEQAHESGTVAHRRRFTDFAPRFSCQNFRDIDAPQVGGFQQCSAAVSS
jgi:hypothetical protein